MMTRDALKVSLKVNLGTEDYDFEDVVVSVFHLKSVIFSGPVIYYIIISYSLNIHGGYLKEKFIFLLFNFQN